MDIKTLSDQDLTTLRGEKRTELAGLTQPAASYTPEQVEQALGLETEIDAIDAEMSTRADKAKRFAALQSGDKKFAGDADVNVDVETSGEEKPSEGADEGSQPANESAEQEGQSEGDSGDGDSGSEGSEGGDSGGESAQAATKTSTVQALAAQTTRPEVPNVQRKPLSITAAADVPEFSSGQQLETLDQVGRGVINRARGFSSPDGDGKSVDIRKFGTAMFALDFEDELIVDKWEDAQEVFHSAANESRLPGGSLVAAGGWCSPSETVYDLSQDATTEGMLSLPEVAVKRGGIRYAQSPVFADFYANPGFKQTETQAIAGTTKPCIEITCPSFTDKRLDVNGICIKVPILTNAAYPEVVANFVAGTMVAHQHWVNADVIGQIVTFAGAARVFTGVGSTVADTLEALELVIIQRRQKYRLGLKQTMEVLLPFWARGALRADLALRNGRATVQAVSDAEIDAHFRSIGANVQWLYDWQAIDETAEVYPGTFQALVYPAGTFVKGTAPVINLSTVYDAASLAENTYTGLFSEQGLLVAKMKFGVDLVTLPIENNGRMGALDIGAAA